MDTMTNGVAPLSSRPPFFKKKWFFITLAAVAFLAMVGLGVYIALRPDPPAPIRGICVYGDYEYEVLEDDTISILAYTGNDTDVFIPIALEGRLVSRIGDFAFSQNDSIVTVKIHPGVKEIGEYAFLNCIALASVEFDEGLEILGTGAFHQCELLEEVSLPDSIREMGDMVFSQ